MRHVCAAKDLKFESSLGQALRNASSSIDLALNKVLQRDGIAAAFLGTGYQLRMLISVVNSTS
jgi:hypothetical protein